MAGGYSETCFLKKKKKKKKKAEWENGPYSVAPSIMQIDKLFTEMFLFLTSRFTQLAI